MSWAGRWHPPEPVVVECAVLLEVEQKLRNRQFLRNVGALLGTCLQNEEVATLI